MTIVESFGPRSVIIGSGFFAGFLIGYAFTVEN